MCTEVNTTSVHHRAGCFFGRVIDQRADAGRACFNPLAHPLDALTQKELCRRAAADVTGTNGENPVEHVKSPIPWRHAESKASSLVVDHALAALHRADQGASHATTFRPSAASPNHCRVGSPKVVLDFATQEQPHLDTLLFGEASFDAQRIALDSADQGIIAFGWNVHHTVDPRTRRQPDVPIW
jgi:hypothetical protein